MFDLFITGLVGTAASTISGIAGGGGGMFVAPFFIIMGFTPATAVATAKFGAIGVALGALTKFRNSRELVRSEFVPSLIIATVIGTVIGSYVLLHTDEAIMRTFIGFMMLGSLPLLFLNKHIGITASSPSPTRRKAGYSLYGGVVVLQAAFSGGIGALHPLIMMGMLGCTALESSATRRIPGLIAALLALGIYMASGVVDYSHGFAMMFGSFIGGWYGTHIALKIGDFYVKWALVIVVILLSTKLLL